MSRGGRLRWAALGAVLGGLAVAAGAFGAHALRQRLDPSALASWETAARYQMYHSLALLASAAPLRPGGTRALGLARICFLAGVFLFSGSLYAVALTGRTWLGAITPIGGGVLLAGWLCLAVGLLWAPPANAASS